MTLSRCMIVFSVLAAAASGLAQGAPVRPPITGISHLGLYGSDSAKTDYFYVHDLGAVKRDDPENPKGVRYYFSAVQFIEVLPFPDGYTGMSRLDHVAYDTTDAEGLRVYLAAHDIAVPASVSDGSDGSRWFDVSDPEGNKVEFLQPPKKSAPVPLNPLSKHIIHMGYLVHSRSAEDAFYRTALGFRPYWYGAFPDGKVSPQWVSQQVPNGTDWLEYMMVPGPETKGIPAGMSQHDVDVLNHFSLGVPNMEKAVTSLWSDRLSAPHDEGAKIGLDGKWQFNLYDPDGTRVEMMEFHASIKPCCSPFTASDPKK